MAHLVQVATLRMVASARERHAVILQSLSPKVALRSCGRIVICGDINGWQRTVAVMRKRALCQRTVANKANQGAWRVTCARIAQPSTWLCRQGCLPSSRKIRAIRHHGP
eukprot:5469899-Prymnesium_polylepis.1